MRVLGHSLKSRDRNSSKPQLPNINRKNRWDFPFFIFIPPCMSVLPYIFANTILSSTTSSWCDMAIPPFPQSACGRLSHIQSLSGSGKDNLTISALLRNPLIATDGLVLISLSTNFWGLGPIRKKGHELDTQPNSVNSLLGNAEKGHILFVCEAQCYYLQPDFPRSRGQEPCRSAHLLHPGTPFTFFSCIYISDNQPAIYILSRETLTWCLPYPGLGQHVIYLG